MDDSTCLACTYNSTDAQCKRKMAWEWRGELREQLVFLNLRTDRDQRHLRYLLLLSYSSLFSWWIRTCSPSVGRRIIRETSQTIPSTEEGGEDDTWEEESSRLVPLSRKFRTSCSQITARRCTVSRRSRRTRWENRQSVNERMTSTWTPWRTSEIAGTFLSAKPAQP